MFCSLTGQVPIHPVISTKTGHLYERSVIERYVNESGLCPHTNQAHTIADLLPIPVNAVLKPRNITGNSIPDALCMFQNEWDALMLEAYKTKEQLDQTRQELAQALYQQDAACRVISRLLKERDEARGALSNANIQAAPTQAGALPEDILKRLQQVQQQLSGARHKRAVSSTLATPQQIEQYTCSSTDDRSTAALTCLDVHKTNQNLVVTGAQDGTVLVSSQRGSAADKTVASLNGHVKTISKVLFHPREPVVCSSSLDTTIRVWRPTSDALDAFNTAVVIRAHSAEVAGLSLHPTGDFLASASFDKTWAFIDLQSGVSILQISHPQVNEAYSCCQFHPDGMLLGTGSRDSIVRIWDMRAQTLSAKFEGHEGAVTDVSFSENGFYMATSALDATIKLWDLRKALLNFRTIKIESAGRINAIKFDLSGNYLAGACSDLRVFSIKSTSSSHVKQFTDHGGPVMDMVWGPDARFVASCSADRSVKFFGAPAAIAAGAGANSS